MNVPTRQHWVPKVYLKRFATQTSVASGHPHAWLYDLDKRSSSCPSLDEIAVKRNLYTIDVGAEKNYSIEATFLQKIETEIDETLEKLTQGQDVVNKDQHRRAMSMFLATLFLRNRRAIKMHEELRMNMKESAEHVDGAVVVKTDRDEKSFTWSLEQWQELISLGPDGMRQLFARSIVSLAPDVSDALRSKQWRLLHASEGYLISSDNPLVVNHPTADHWGLGTEGVHISIALSPRYGLYIGEETRGSPGEVLEMDAGAIRAMNYFTLTQAERFAISAREFNDIQDLLDEVV